MKQLQVLVEVGTRGLKEEEYEQVRSASEREVTNE